MARPWTSLDVPRMVKLYAAGGTVDTIAAEMGVNKVTVSRRLRAAGITMRPGGVPRNPVSDDELLRLRGQGLSWREVGEQVGMTTAGVHARWRRMHNQVDPRPPTSDTNRVLELHKRGLSTKEIAAEMDQATTTIARKLRAGGVQLRRGGVSGNVNDAELLRLRAEGLLWRQVAERVGMTRSGVTARVVRMRETGRLGSLPRW